MRMPFLSRNFGLVMSLFVLVCGDFLSNYLLVLILVLSLHSNFCYMKKDIHPDDYRLVVFKDMSNEYAFVCPSCAPTKDTITWEDGQEYPLVKLDISHKSHPFFTGIAQFVDTAGRIDKFKNRFGKTMK